MILIKDKLPEKGKNIIAICSDGEKREVYRCSCHNPNCREWRCSLTGYGLMINVRKWQYVSVINRQKKLERLLNG